MKQILIISLLLIALFSNGQNFNYWSMFHGVRAQYLAGAVNGSVYDNTAVLYNPASTAFVDGTNLSLSANTASVRVFNMKNAVGEGKDLRYNRLSIIPQLIAGVVNLKKQPKLYIGYMIVNTTDFKSDFYTSSDGSAELIDTIAGAEYFTTNYRAQRKINISKAAVSVAYKFNENISIGGSFIGLVKTDRFLNIVSLYVGPLGDFQNTYASVNSGIDFDYWHIGGEFKLSTAFSYPRFRFGMNVKLPSFGIIGRANVLREVSAYNLPVYPQNDYLFTSQVGRVKAESRNPASIGFGLGGKIAKKGWLHLSGEYFFKQKDYYVFNESNDVKVVPSSLSQEDVVAIFDGEQFLSYKERRDQVLNLGLSYSHRFEDLLELLVGFRTDFSYSYPSDRYFELNKVKVLGVGLNSYYLSAGVVTFGKRISKFSVGVDFGFTTQVDHTQFVNISEPDLNTLLQDRIRNSKVSQYVIRLSLGIELDFLTKKGDSK